MNNEYIEQKTCTKCGEIFSTKKKWEVFCYKCWKASQRQDEQLIKEKLEEYKKSNMEVHIVLMGGKWLNAFIISEKSPGVYIIQERKIGTMHLFLKEIFSVSEVVGETFNDGTDGGRRSLYQP